MPVRYDIRRKGKPWDATIYQGKKKVGEISTGQMMEFKLESSKGEEWTLSTNVDGEIRPFSINVTKVAKGKSSKVHRQVLVIRDKLFMHGKEFYTLLGSPGDRPLNDFVLGRRYIVRLGALPFSSIQDIDEVTKSRLRHYRGVPVGELDGLGRQEHRVTLADELKDVGLQLAASSYLLLSTG